MIQGVLIMLMNSQNDRGPKRIVQKAAINIFFIIHILSNHLINQVVLMQWTFCVDINWFSEEKNRFCVSSFLCSCKFICSYWNVTKMIYIHQHMATYQRNLWDFLSYYFFPVTQWLYLSLCAPWTVEQIKISLIPTDGRHISRGTLILYILLHG